MGTLYIVSTPIGNLEDITIRAMKTLFSVDYIACEDTRRTGFLLTQLKAKFTTLIYSNVVKRGKPKLISYYDEIESLRSLEIIDLLLAGNDVALVSDSGTPLIADPGFKLVNECIRRNIKVVSIPGPAALIAALSSAGLPTNQFLFLGYPPEKKNQRVNLFVELLSCFKTSEQIRPTYIFYCAPHKLEKVLMDLKEIFGDMEITLARELTKKHEEVWRGKVSQALSYFQKPVGEFVILFSPKNPDV